MPTVARRILVPLAALLVAAGLAARAEEIVHFTNGTTMAVRSHRVEGSMIRVDLGANAVMAFPVGQVERITEAGQDVYLQPSQRQANVVLSGDDGAAAVPERYPVTGESTVPSRFRGRKGGGKDAKAVAAASPYYDPGPGASAAGPVSGLTPRGADAAPALGRLGVQGDVRLYGAGRTADGRSVIPPPPSRGRSTSGVEVRRFLPSDGVAKEAIRQGESMKPPPATPPAGSDGGGQGSKD